LLRVAAMMMRELQRHAVDAIKRHALVLSLGSPRAQRRILTEYLWSEEGAEATALGRIEQGGPAWLGKLVARQLEDERRHAALLRDRLAELDVDPDDLGPAARARLAGLKLAWLERACAPYTGAFAAGPVVIVLAAAAQLEATGVRVFGRHLAVLEERAAGDPTTGVIRSILGDEQRHARSCAAALDRLVGDDERTTLAELRARIARIDRAFGVTLALAYWVSVAACVLRDHAAPAIRRAA
jgi:hypothetical protein